MASVFPSSDVHIDGLLHLATLAFALTLAYLGFDRVSDRAREGLEKDLSEKEKEIGDFLRNDERIHTDGTVNRLRDHVGFRVRRSLCMLLTLGNIKHDIYDGVFGGLIKASHRVQLFFSFRCYLTHWDLFAIKLAAAISAVAFFSLTGVTTFRMEITPSLVAFIFVVDGATILLIVLAAWHSASARATLEKRYQKWKNKYRVWAEVASTELLRTGERLIARPIIPPPAAANTPSTAAIQGAREPDQARDAQAPHYPDGDDPPATPRA